MTFGETKRTHPIRGLLWGIMLGLGLAVVLIVTTVISLDLTQIIIVIILGMVIGVLWGLFGPAKQPKGPRPSPSALSEPTSSAEITPRESEPLEAGDAADGSAEIDDTPDPGTMDSV